MTAPARAWGLDAGVGADDQSVLSVVRLTFLLYSVYHNLDWLIRGMMREGYSYVHL